MRKTLLMCLLGTSLFVTGCTDDKKDGPQPTPSQTNKEKISDKDFKLVAATADPAIKSGTGAMITDIFPFIDSCTRDDLYRFNSSGAYIVDEGPTKCDPNDPQASTGTWAFDLSEQILVFTIGNEVQSCNIITNDGTTLKFSYVETIDGKDHVITDTYKKQ